MPTTSDSSFHLVRLEIGGHPVLVAYGELDAVSSPKLHEALQQILEENPTTVLVDLANVTFLDSSALGALVVAHNHLHERGGELRLVAVPDAVARILEITGLAVRFHVYANTEAATSAVPPS